MPSRLPPDLATRHHTIHDKAIQKAKQSGWSGEMETGDEE
jgi:hypothetical protein